jgi:predicted CXXCH cytochrome family protein
MLLTEPMDLCLSCHDHVLDAPDGKLCDVAKLLDENVSHHGPIIQENCTGCHKVHGGESFRMLVEDFPSSFYASFDEANYKLCFRCHEPDLVRNEKTTKLTNFRNGEQNLHYVHVHRKPKGRTCRACHNVHASKKPKHITETVKFGIWEIPLNFEKTATGGSCQPGCHRVYRYDQTKCIVNVPRSSDAG